MRKCGMQNLSVEAAEAISFGGDQRNNFENSVGGDPSARVTYDPLAKKQPRKRTVPQQLAQYDDASSVFG